MPDRAVITGMRQLGQIALLRESSDLNLISLDADPIIRFERAKKNKKLGEATTLEEFISNESAENSEPNAQHLFECMDLANCHMINEGTIKELYAQIDSIFSF